MGNLSCYQRLTSFFVSQLVMFVCFIKQTQKGLHTHTYFCNSKCFTFSVTLLYLRLRPFAETVLWENRLQQGHVQQVDQSGQGARGRPEDIQDRMC